MAGRREHVPNLVLKRLRETRGLSQQEVAEGLNQLDLARRKGVQIDNVTFSRWERGVIESPLPLHRRLLAEFFGVALDELGFVTSVRRDAVQSAPADVDAFLISHTPTESEPRVQVDQEQWRQVRRRLNQHRVPLARVAAELHAGKGECIESGLVSDLDWLPKQPIPLAAVQLTYADASGPPSITGAETESRQTRPLLTSARRFRRYSYALRDLDHPGLFENRLSYRLLGVSWDHEGAELEFGHTTYFEAVDVGEALAHELAAAHVAALGSVGKGSWRSLRFRKLVGKPAELRSRPQLASVDTLTIRRQPDGRATFVLHDRSSARVAVAGGMLHVMPAGVFQPSSLEPTAFREDFDLWRNIMREYSEEFLGNAEHSGDGRPFDYGTEPFASLESGYQAGRIQAWWLGFGLDPLTLFGEILTVVVFDAEVYDELFADMVHANDEGQVVMIGSRSAPTTAIPFDQLTVPRLLEHGSLAPAAAACLRLAWEHREVLLAS